MPTKKDPIQGLFESRLRRMSLNSFKKHCETNGWRESDVRSLSWIDEKGKRWSAMGRLGYLQFTSPSRCRNGSLMEHLVRVARPGLSQIDGPSETDMLWAWLGHTSFAPSASQANEFRTMLAQFPALSSDIPASGFGVSDDGGWLGKALDLVEEHSRQHGTPPLALQWAADEVASNLLGGPSLAYLRAWELGASGSSWPASSPSSRLPSSTGSPGSPPRPAALEGAFDEAFSRRLRLLEVLVRKSSTPSQGIRLALGFLRDGGDSLGLLPCLGKKSQSSLVDLLDSLCDVPKDKPAWSMIVPVMNAVSSLGGEAIAPPSLLKKARMEMEKPAQTLPGDPGGSIMDWSRHEVLPCLEGWLRAGQMEESFPVAHGLGPARKIRM